MRAETDMNVVVTGDGRVRRGAGHRRGRAVPPRRARRAARPRGRRLRRRSPQLQQRGARRREPSILLASPQREEARRAAAHPRPRRCPTSRSSASTTSPPTTRCPRSGATFADNALHQGARGLRAHRPADRRRRLRADRRRAQRHARRAVGALGRAATATTRPTCAWCSPSSPTPRTSGSAPRSCARSRFVDAARRGRGRRPDARPADPRAARRRTASATTRSSCRTATTLTSAELPSEREGRDQPPRAGAARARRTPGRPPGRSSRPDRTDRTDRTDVSGGIIVTTTAAWAAAAADAPLAPSSSSAAPSARTTSASRSRYCGICHSDLHTARNEWHGTSYPVVPGHEIVGEVVEVGPDVTRHAVGDRVGVGCMVDSCGECEECRDGLQNYCRARRDVHLQLARPGRHHRAHPGRLLRRDRRHRGVRRPVPDSLEPAAAAPILCAGITMYSPLRHHGVGRAVRSASPASAASAAWP